MSTETEWAISIECAGPPEDDPVEEIDVAMLVDLLPHAVATGASHHYGVTFGVDGDDINDALESAAEAWLVAVKRAELPEWPVVRLEAITCEEQDRWLASSGRPELVGVREVAEILGVSKQRVSELARQPAFPEPFVTLAAGPIWAKRAVLNFLEQWPRRAGRPPKPQIEAGRLGIEVGVAPVEPTAAERAGRKRVVRQKPAAIAATRSGIYELIGPRGERIGGQMSVAKGDTLPPAPEPGMGWRFVDPMATKGSTR